MHRMRMHASCFLWWCCLCWFSCASVPGAMANDLDPCIGSWPKHLRPNSFLERLKARQMSDTRPAPPSNDGLPKLDWRIKSDRELAKEMQAKEWPFLLQHVPDIDAAVLRWKEDEYLKRRMGDAKHMVTVSHSNRFMYYREDKALKSRTYERPTTSKKMTLEEFLKQPMPEGSSDTHYYFLAGRNDHNWIAEEMPTFRNLDEGTKLGLGYGNRPLPPHLNETKKSTAFNQVIRDDTESGIIGRQFLGVDENGVPQNAGLFFNAANSSRATVSQTGFSSGDRYMNMRIGQKGVIAEGHIDVSRNFIVMMRGSRRYLLFHPCECFNTYIDLSDKNDPEYRHWKIRPDLPDFDIASAPLLEKARALDVTIEAGDILYVPSFWIHYLVSLTNHNIQLNIRSGIALEGFDHIEEASGARGVQRRMELERLHLSRQKKSWKVLALAGLLLIALTWNICRRQGRVWFPPFKVPKSSKGIL